MVGRGRDVLRDLQEASRGVQDALECLDDPFWTDDAVYPLTAVKHQLDLYLADPDLLLDPSQGAELVRVEEKLDSVSESWLWDNASVLGLISDARVLVRRVLSDVHFPATEVILNATRPTAAIRVQVQEAISTLVSRLGSDPREWHRLGSRVFEEVLAEMWRGMGWETILTPPSGDGGLDLRAIKSDGGICLCYLIEAKAYAPGRPVGIDIVKTLYGVVERERASHGILATTSSFTRGAVSEAKALKYRVSLADFKTVHAWVEQYRRRTK